MQNFKKKSCLNKDVYVIVILKIQSPNDNFSVKTFHNSLLINLTALSIQIGKPTPWKTFSYLHDPFSTLLCSKKKKVACSLESPKSRGGGKVKRTIELLFI